MEKEFIPYEQALALKGIEFDEPCLAFYYDKTKFLSLGERPEYLISKRKASYIFGNEDHDVTLAPTFSAAFRWFREKYNLYGCSKPTFSLLEPSKIIFFYYWIEDGNEYTNITEFNTPEEAELECLKKLIEIVKTN